MVAGLARPLQDEGGAELGRNRVPSGRDHFRGPSCSQRGFMSQWLVASTLDPPGFLRFRGLCCLMKRFSWIILAACLGATGLSSPSHAVAADCSPGQVDRWVMPRDEQTTIHASLPIQPGQQSAGDALLFECNPESETDEDGRLVMVGGLERDLNLILGSFFPTNLAPLPGPAPGSHRLPRWFPIRC